MNKTEQFVEYVYRNHYRFIGWMNDEVTVKFLGMIDENIEDYTKMLKYQSPSDIAKVVQIQSSIQLLELLRGKLNELLKDVTQPVREEVEDAEDEY